MIFRFIPIFLLVASPLVMADSLDVSFNNDALAFKYSSAMAALIQGNSDLQFGLLYNDAMNSLADVGLLIKGDDSDSGMTITVGTSLIAGMIKNYAPGTTQNVESIVIGAELGYIFPVAKQISIAFYYFAGPQITTFGDADRANQWGAHLDYEVNAGTRVYFEYRQTDFRITATGLTATVDSGTYMGVKLAL
jgi:predicted porin